jgi:hypothetical protein
VQKFIDHRDRYQLLDIETPATRIAVPPSIYVDKPEAAGSQDEA